MFLDIDVVVSTIFINLKSILYILALHLALNMCFLSTPLHNQGQTLQSQAEHPERERKSHLSERIPGWLCTLLV